MTEQKMTYAYDGSFAGFLTCVADSRRSGIRPVGFTTAEDGRISLFPVRTIETDRQAAQVCYRTLQERISPAGRELATKAFLTCMVERELAICDFLRLGEQIGPGVIHWITDDRVAPLLRAVKHLHNEAHLLKGFVRFSEYQGFLAAEITPKNRVLPLLRPHFCERLNTENFLIYDKTHGDVLFHRCGPYPPKERSRIVSATDLQLPETLPQEAQWQSLWKTFYETVAIEGRYNPKLRQNHVPKRYWQNMTELRDKL